MKIISETKVVEFSVVEKSGNSNLNVTTTSGNMEVFSFVDNSARDRAFVDITRAIFSDSNVVIDVRKYA